MWKEKLSRRDLIKKGMIASALVAAGAIGLARYPSVVALQSQTSAIDLSRAIITRIYEHSNCCVKGHVTNGRVDRAYVVSVLGSVRPTFVSGLFRMDKGYTPTQGQISDYNAIVSGVNSVSTTNVPFDIVLNISNYSTLQQAENDLDRIEALGLQNSGYFYDQITTPKITPQECMELSAYANSKYGKFIGGNAFSGDFKWNWMAPVDDFPKGSALWSFSQKIVDSLEKSGTAIAGHLNNNPQTRNSECYQFNGYADTNNLDYAGRTQVITSQAQFFKNQGLHYLFPVLGFPQGNNPYPSTYGYDANADNNMIENISALMG